jgi:hypothetical protein
MGIGKLATWLALFALLANAGSGLGLEQARPDTSLAVATICTTQATINTLMQPKDATTKVDVCALQTSLGSTALPHESTVSAESDSLLLAVLCASPELLAPPMMRSTIPFDDREVESASRQEAAQVVACLPPPKSLPLEHARHTLRTPNGPPVTA